MNQTVILDSLCQRTQLTQSGFQFWKFHGVLVLPEKKKARAFFPQNGEWKKFPPSQCWHLIQWILPLRNHAFNNLLNYTGVTLLGKTFASRKGAFGCFSGNDGGAEALCYCVTGFPNKQVFALLNVLCCFSRRDVTQVFLLMAVVHLG